MYADTMPGEIAAWVQVEQAKCAAATEIPMHALGLQTFKLPATYVQLPAHYRGFIASARTGYPVLLDYATGLLARYAEKQADWDHYLATLGKSERAWDEACTDEPVHYLQREIAALHAALVAQGLIGGKG